MEQSNNFNNQGGGKGPKMPRFNMNWLYTIILIALIALFFSGGGDALGGGAAKEATYTEFKQYVDKGYVLSVVANKTENTLKIYINPKYTRDVYKMSAQNVGPNPYVKVQFGSVDEVDRYGNQMVKEKKIRSFSYDNKKDNDFWNLIISLAPLLLFFLFIYWMSGRMGSGMSNMGGGIFNVGKSKAKMYEKGNAIGITFKDVAGQEGAKQEVQEIVDFLKNPKKYTDLGGKIPKGALLVGPPGTGKTLLAKAVAGEAGVPFFSMSGSDFVEMFVGVGASRVRDLFRQAKEKSPSIIFIDEIDAIGKSRNAGGYGGNDEREQTLNQLLSEMDGFDSSKGILILAATNRPEVLDQALLRPGRFDRRVIVDKPDLEGRIQILKVHAKNVKMDETVDFREVALATSGAVGADLANMINEAAILAVRNHRQAVSQKDLLDSVEVVLVGKEKKSRVLSKEERKIVSYHEVGHALVSAIQKHSEPVQKITIVPRTMGALGYVMNVPEEEKYLNSEEEIRAMLVEFTAGRVAEELVFGSITTGASNDIEKATRIARAMVTQYGMSKRFGFVQLESQTSQYLDDGRRVMNCSEQTAAEVDEEVMTIMKQSYEQARKILTEHRKALDQIAAFLIEKETITGKEFMDILAKVEQPDNTAGSESTEKTEA